MILMTLALLQSCSKSKNQGTKLNENETSNGSIGTRTGGDPLYAQLEVAMDEASKVLEKMDADALKNTSSSFAEAKKFYLDNREKLLIIIDKMKIQNSTFIIVNEELFDNGMPVAAKTEGNEDNFLIKINKAQLISLENTAYLMNLIIHESYHIINPNIIMEQHALIDRSIALLNIELRDQRNLSDIDLSECTSKFYLTNDERFIYCLVGNSSSQNKAVIFNTYTKQKEYYPANDREENNVESLFLSDDGSIFMLDKNQETISMINLSAKNAVKKIETKTLIDTQNEKISRIDFYKYDSVNNYLVLDISTEAKNKKINEYFIYDLKTDTVKNRYLNGNSIASHYKTVMSSDYNYLFSYSGYIMSTYQLENYRLDSAIVNSFKDEIEKNDCYMDNRFIEFNAAKKLLILSCGNFFNRGYANTLIYSLDCGNSSDPMSKKNLLSDLWFYTISASDSERIYLNKFKEDNKEYAIYDLNEKQLITNLPSFPYITNRWGVNIDLVQNDTSKVILKGETQAVVLNVTTKKFEQVFSINEVESYSDENFYITSKGLLYRGEDNKTQLLK